LKFLLLTQCYPPEIGGAQVLMGSLATELKRQGHEVKVVTALPNYPTGEIFRDYRGRLVVREEIDGIPVFRSWIYAAQSARLFPRLMNYFSFCLTSLLSFRWIGKPDVIFVDSPPLFLCLTALFLARLKGATWVMNVSDLWPDAVADSGLVQSGLLLNMAAKLERFLYRAADFVSSVTEGICKILLENKGVPQNKILFLPIGVDTSLFQARPADKALLDKWKLNGKSIFLYAGRVGHSQGLSLVIKAADRLRNRNDIAFVLLGDGPVRKELRAESAELGLTNVLFVDPVPLSEMPRWWSITRGAVVTLKDQPIHLSARPSKSLPAMASAVPVLFSGLGEMVRIISDANAGLVVAPEQVDPLVQGITRLADDAALARQLGENGRRLCEQEFSWQNIVSRWLNEMSQLSNTRRPYADGRHAPPHGVSSPRGQQLFNRF
jgi:glycosyltransferase involved in cell wall biosynthesis